MFFKQYILTIWTEGKPKQYNLVPRARFTFGQHQERDLWPARSDFSVLKSRTFGYTTQNHWEEQDSDKPAVDLLHFAVKYGLERLGKQDVLVRKNSWNRKSDRAKKRYHCDAVFLHLFFLFLHWDHVLCVGNLLMDSFDSYHWSLLESCIEWAIFF